MAASNFSLLVISTVIPASIYTGVPEFSIIAPEQATHDLV